MTTVINDPEGAPLTFNLIGTYPGYVSLTGNIFTFNPGVSIMPIVLTINFDVTDGVNTVSFSFTYEVLNSPPYLDGTLND